MKYFIITHGCQMNEHDSERIAFLLESLSYSPAKDREEADLILLNTCLVRENAELKVFGQVGALKHWKKEKEGRLLLVSGCMMQTGPARDLIREKYPQVDIVFGTQNIDKLPQLLALHRQTGERILDVGSYEDTGHEYERQKTSFAYVNIMTGCNNFCSYCIVPYARGREKSRTEADILQELDKIARQGTKEIMLLGQNVNSYRGDHGDFPALLQRCCEVEGIERIRFMSSHPKDLSDDLIRVMAENPKIERHFHLPLQSGSDRVLKEMNRHYTRERFMERAAKLRETIPDISLTTDIIVGFPGEEEEDHRATLDLCRRVRFDAAFTFLYSKRPGTRAAEREDQVAPQVTNRRFQELLDTLYPIFLEENRKQIGTKARVLVESVSKNEPGMMSGRDSRNKLIHFPGTPALIGRFIDVTIKDCNSFALFAEMQ